MLVALVIFEMFVSFSFDTPGGLPEVYLVNINHLVHGHPLVQLLLSAPGAVSAVALLLSVAATFNCAASVSVYSPP